MAYTTIKKPSDYFNTLTYTGDGNDARGITGVGFQPDFVWSKNRDNGTRYHALTNVISGATKFLSSNATSAEQTDSTTYQSFDSDGFTVGTNANTNENGSGIVSWNWLANGAGVANTDGSISSTVSANTTSGFSVVGYTGAGASATIGHGLGVAPSMYIIKSRTGSAEPWFVYHKSIGNTGGVLLNSTNVQVTSSTWFNNTSPTSSVFSIGSNSGVTGSGNTFIAYCFAEKQGFSKFGSYTGNGSTDGTFVYTGFKPAFVLLKRTDSTGSWYIYDNKRDVSNAMTKVLFPDITDAEDNNTNNNADFLSNGFKIRTISGARNASGGTYIYMAFASEPLVGDNPATAR